MRTLEKQLRATGIALVMSSITTWVNSPVAHAQITSSSPPPTLTGESFAAGSNGITTDSSQCNSDGSGTFTYSAGGTATGPYNGTFTETGSVTIDSSNKIIAYSAKFTVNTAQGTVTGSKTEDPNSPIGGTCGKAPQSGGNILQAQSNYQATITTPSGNYLDQGNVINLIYILLPPFDYSNGESSEFHSTQTQTTLIAPTSKDQCKNDGWKNYPQFKSQGECVNFANHK